MHKPLMKKAIALQEQGNYDAALTLYKKILFKFPRLADAHHLMGVVYLQTQQFDMAITCIRQAIQIDSKNPYYFSNLGVAQLDSENHVEAVDSFIQALVLNPAFAQANFNLGNAYFKLHQYRQAIESYMRATTLDDSQFAYYLNLANAYRAIGDFPSALLFYDISLALNHGDASVWFNKGLCLQQMQETLQAIDYFQQAVAINPEHWESHWSLGRLFISLTYWHKAIDHLTLATAGMPNSHELWNDLGIAQDKALIPTQAVSSLKQAIYLKPNFDQALNNLGTVLHGVQDYAEALIHFELALQGKPDYKEAHVNKAFTLLLNDQLSEGFQSYEYRNLLGEQQPRWLLSNKAIWTGQQDIQGQKLLVYVEQGFGDSIQFARYLPLLKERGPHIVFAVQNCLLPLFAGLTCLSRLVDLNTESTDFDYHVSLMSLPYIFGTVMESIPSDPVHLQVDAGVVLKWAKILGAKTKPLVGLVWSGSATHTNDANRSLQLQHLLKYLPGNFDFIALQKEVRDTDLADLRVSKIRSFEPDIEDFQDTAAICKQLDLVISVDTSVAHLSASLNCPTWIMLPKVPDWRWFLNREDSPWYPSVRLFRQEQAGDWGEVLQRLKTALHEHFN
jgi:tetratricopeptide (TPR) repeat protein